MLNIRMAFLSERREEFDSGRVTVVSKTSKSVELKVKKDISDAEVSDGLNVLFSKFGKPVELTVGFSVLDHKNATDENVADLRKSRKRIFNLVLDMGYKHMYLRPFTAVPSSRYRAIPQGEQS